MRRLRIPIKTSAMAVLILAGAAYVAAEARQAILRREQLELAEIENSAGAVQPSGSSRSSPISPERGLSLSSQRQPQASVAGRQVQLSAAKPATSQRDHNREIVISIPDRRLALLEDGQPVKFYPIAVGTRRTPSPEGEYQIINHAKDPTYRHNGKEIAPGKDNPLGDRWMGLSLKGYGIHGTNMPRSIGKAASHGCFRMAKEDVEDLYSRVQLGDAVTIHGRRDELVAQIFAADSAGPDPNAPKTEIAAATKRNDAQVVSASAPAPAMEAQE
jgi:lipoprotein-anchoring transpeptidase ErfK/SrfK